MKVKNKDWKEAERDEENEAENKEKGAERKRIKYERGNES